MRIFLKRLDVSGKTPTVMKIFFLVKNTWMYISLIGLAFENMIENEEVVLRKVILKHFSWVYACVQDAAVGSYLSFHRLDTWCTEFFIRTTNSAIETC